MAKLMVTAQGNRGETHRLGSQYVHARLQSWSHKLYVTLDKDGNWDLTISNIKTGELLQFLSGNVSEVKAQ